MNEEAQLRLFIAVELPPIWLLALSRVEEELQRVAGSQVKWVRPDLMHLTLVFLGYQPQDRLPAIENALAAAAESASPFHLTMAGLGSFGSPSSLHVLWAGLKEMPRELQLLHQEIGRQLSSQKVSFDLKPLVPHITLGRGRRPIDRSVSLRLHACLGKIAVPLGLSTRVEEFVLMQSRLSRSGPEYEVLSRWPLRRI